MPVRLNIKKWVTGFGVIGGAMLFYPNDDNNNQLSQKHDSWMSFPFPFVKWDYNWDRREPKSLIKPMKVSGLDQNEYNKELASKTATAMRHIILIRHGQYNIKAKTDADATLTDLGRKQAEATGKRLQELGFPYALLVHSSMTRAKETANIMLNDLKNISTVECDSLLNEGAPIPPEPPSSNWKPTIDFYRDGPRIEAAFRKYFHRADFDKKKDSYTILVCHANVIRYFVCRALQFPPTSWLRLSLNHASITWITIYPDGIVKLRAYSDTGHMKPQLILNSNQ